MFTQTWKKYLPVIFILLKRAASEDQQLQLNSTDFVRAAGGRKIKYSFSSFTLTKGKWTVSSGYPAIARELGQLLAETDSTRGLVRTKDFHFSLTNDFKLSISQTADHLVAQEESNPQ
jgi:hypothetical protein